MGQRLALHQLFKDIPEVAQVYFQPPEGYLMEYPCIVYQRDYAANQHADNNPYRSTKRYLVTVIDEDPDSTIFDAVAGLPMCSFNRFFAANELNHQVFNLYF